MFFHITGFSARIRRMNSKSLLFTINKEGNSETILT